MGGPEDRTRPGVQVRRYLEQPPHGADHARLHGQLYCCRTVGQDHTQHPRGSLEEGGQAVKEGGRGGTTYEM